MSNSLEHYKGLISEREYTLKLAKLATTTKHKQMVAEQLANIRTKISNHVKQYQRSQKDRV